MPSSEVMHKYKHGTLRSGGPDGPKVHSRAQAIAIMMSEKRKEEAHGGHYPEGHHHGHHHKKKSRLSSLR
jgi:hypothetical protein